MSEQMENRNKSELLAKTEEYAEEILEAMRGLDVTDPLHAELRKAYDSVTKDIVNLKEGDAKEAERINAETSRNAWKWQIATNALTSSLTGFVQPVIGHYLNRQNVKSVTGYEKEDILNTKSLKFMK